MVPVLQRNANSNMAADTSGTKIQPMCIYQSLIDGFRRVKEKSCFRSTPFPFSIPPSTMIILYHFSADKSISNSSSLARTSARKFISSLCHLNNKKTKKGKKRKAQSYLRFPPINLIHLVTRSCWKKKNKDQDSYGWQAS